MNETERNTQIFENAKVSIIVATFHRDQPLFNALESLIKQTYPNIEIIVVDDNADAIWNSKVSQIVKHFQDNSQRGICLIQNSTNQGSARTRNIGVENATGMYISFLDDDDVYYSNKIEIQLNDMISSNADFGITDLDLYNTKEVLLEKRKRSYLLEYDSNSLLKYHLKYHLTGTDTIMFKKAYFVSIGGFPLIDVGDEYYLMEQAIINGGRFCYSNQCLVKAYVHDGKEAGLSSGEGKIIGENALYNNKQKYFDRISKKDKKYITMRHYAVLAFAYLRSKQYGRFLLNASKSFIVSPIECLRLLKERR